MSAPAFDTRWIVARSVPLSWVLTVVLSFVLCALAASDTAAAQPQPASPKTGVARVPAPPPQSVDDRYALQVLVATLDVYAEPNRAAAIIAELQEAARIEA